MSKIFKPHRGKKSIMISDKKDIILNDGEFFIEQSDDNSINRAKVGDGTTTYENLPYLSGDASNDKIEITNDTSESVDDGINKITNGTKLKILIGVIKQIFSLFNTRTTTLEKQLNGYTIVLVDSEPTEEERQPMTIYLTKEEV